MKEFANVDYDKRNIFRRPTVARFIHLVTGGSVRDSSRGEVDTSNKSDLYTFYSVPPPVSKDRHFHNLSPDKLQKV